MTATPIEATLDPMAGRIIPREDLDTLNPAQLREKYPKAFSLMDKVEAEWAEDAKKEDAAKIPLHIMANEGYLRHFDKKGKTYFLVDITANQEIAISKMWIAEGKKPEEQQLSNGEMLAEVCGAFYLQVYDPETMATRPVTRAEVLKTFKIKEINRFISEANGEDEQGENPPA